jgi:BNR repeat-like domain
VPRLATVPRAAAVLATIGLLLSAASLPAPSFTTATRLGYVAGDDWEPATAADAHQHVYALWSHYGPDPACQTCASPHSELQVSSDGGQSWSAPRALAPSALRQDDPQIEVDPADGRTVFAAFMQGNKSSEYVARSDDFGQTWHPVLVESLQRGTDKDILAVRGQDVYLGYHTQQKIFVSASHDGGANWTLQQPMQNTSKLGVSLASGAAIDSSGVVHFAWNGVQQAGQAKGDINLYITSSSNGGATWQTTLVGVSAAPPDCGCPGWDYWGAQMALAVDDLDRVHVLWQASVADRGPNRLYYATSTNRGASFSGPQLVSDAPITANNVFPAIVTGRDDRVVIAWMDDRNGHDAGGDDPDARWNTYARVSDDGGASWSGSAQLSTYVGGYTYKLATPRDGFLQPYGDYFELAVDSTGTIHALWGEGNSYVGPGNVWYASGN